MRPDRADTDSRLRNWGRWARSGGRRQAGCGSAEGRYVAPWPDDEAVARAAALPVDAQDAEFVESCVMFSLDGTSRKFVRLHYDKQAGRHEIARKMKFWDPNLFESRLDALLDSVAQALASHKPARDRRMAFSLRFTRVVEPAGWRYRGG